VSELTKTASSALSEAAEPVMTGWSGGAGYFRFTEFDGLRPAAIVDVLRGRALGAVFRGAVTPATCEQIAARFWASPAGRSRGGEAPIRYLGAYHYHKPTSVYLNECEAIAAAFDEAMAVGDDPLEAVYGGLAGALTGQGITVRRAEHDGRQAARGVLRSWFGRGEFALVPHEDRGQCREPGQSDFEIQRVLGYCICALNICLENGTGGRLRIWNMQPDDVTKRRLGTFYSGSPYPVSSLEGTETIRLDIHQGDIYIFNGSHVHAVEPNTVPGTRRTTLSGFFGLIDDTTVVSWT
jgi:hypothetical protein